MSLEMNPNGPFPGDSAFRRESLKGTQWEPTYAGALSFMRRKYSRDLKGVDITVTGIPFDQAVSHRSGTRMGPEGASILSTRWPSSTTATASSTGAARRTSRSASRTMPPRSFHRVPR